MDFKQSSNDPCIYISTTDSLLILAVYANDIVLAGKSQQTIASVKTKLGKHFWVKDTGEPHYFLGVNVSCNWQDLGWSIILCSDCLEEIWTGELYTCCYTSGHRNQAAKSY